MDHVFADGISNTFYWKQFVCFDLNYWGPVDYKSPVVWVMAGAEQATRNYLNQWWPSSLTNICIPRFHEKLNLQGRHINIMASQITGMSTFCSTSFYANNKRQHQSITGPLWGESTGHQWIPLTKGQLCGKSFHVLPSSWNIPFLEYLGNIGVPYSLQGNCGNPTTVHKNLLTCSFITNHGGLFFLLFLLYTVPNYAVNGFPHAPTISGF